MKEVRRGTEGGAYGNQAPFNQSILFSNRTALALRERNGNVPIVMAGESGTSKQGMAKREGDGVTIGGEKCAISKVLAKGRPPRSGDVKRRLRLTGGEGLAKARKEKRLKMHVMEKKGTAITGVERPF